MADVLSQGEIDALLSATDGGEGEIEDDKEAGCLMMRLRSAS